MENMCCLFDLEKTYDTTWRYRIVKDSYHIIFKTFYSKENLVKCTKDTPL